MSTAPRAGYVALAGLPNAGKSSLLNAFVEQRLSIVNGAPQTTRERVVGIDTREGAQIIFLDTPGIPEARMLLHRSMETTIREALTESDVIVLVADASRPQVQPPQEFLAALPKDVPLLIALNKADIASPDRMDVARDLAGKIAAQVVEVSARTGAGVGALRRRLVECLPESPFLYPPDEIATQSTRFFAAELIRETALELYAEEVPHGLAVKIDEFREGGEPVYIRATVYTERASQKAILLGRGGAAIKRLGRDARHKIEELVGQRVYLDLWVKVLPRWRKDPDSLRRLGFVLPPPSRQ